jgi:hypothetical protein
LGLSNLCQIPKPGSKVLARILEVDVRVLEFAKLAESALLPIARAGRACRDCQLVAFALLA